jgi:DNA-binding CsgD family transcriptional regulator
MLVDRENDRKSLDGALEMARAGSSYVLVLFGEAGIGKTTLLDYAADRASDFRVVRAYGFESESAIGFAGIHQVLAPFLAHIDALPEPQARALGQVFGTQMGGPPDRFLVGLGALTLLSDAAARQPLLCTVDDAQWLDSISADVLGFIARRLHADPVVMLFAQRGDALEGSLSGLPQARVEGLPSDAAFELLCSVVDGPVGRRTGERVAVETGGNPLALVELSAELTRSQLSGQSSLPEPLPIEHRLQEHFLRQLRQLSTDEQTLLLLNAAEPAGAPGVLRRAAEALGVTETQGFDAGAYWAPGLTSRTSLRHPLARSAIYHGATAARRRQVHAALAQAFDPDLEPGRRAWHLALSVIDLDENVASDLETAAKKVLPGGGSAQAAELTRQAALRTPVPHERARRFLRAVQLELAAGYPGLSQIWLREAEPWLREDPARAEAVRLEGAIRYARGDLNGTAGLLLDAAGRLAPSAPSQAQEAFLEAMQAAIYAGCFAGEVDAVTVARHVLEGALPPEPATASGSLLEGFATLLSLGYAPAAPLLRRAAARLLDGAPDVDDLRWMMLGCLAAGELWDSVSFGALVAKWVQGARQYGLFTTLAVALNYQTWFESHRGLLAAAGRSCAEEMEISTATQNPGVVGSPGAGRLLWQVWSGQEAEARATAAAMTVDSRERSQGAGVTHATSAMALLEVGLGNYEAAVANLLAVYQEDLTYLGCWCLPDLVEAATRTGNRDLAQLALSRLSERAAASGTDWALGLVARSRAILARGQDSEVLFEQAIDRLRSADVPTDLARAHLLLGEWLRHTGRTHDARSQLRTAADMFQAMGARIFAERARAELAAAGVHDSAPREHDAPKKQGSPTDLTPQEAQIAELAAEGLTNREIAARVLISPSTVDYHLRKVFHKLRVRSRVELARWMTARSAT